MADQHFASVTGNGDAGSVTSIWMDDRLIWTAKGGLLVPREDLGSLRFIMGVDLLAGLPPPRQ